MASKAAYIYWADQNAGFIFTITNESKGLDMKWGSEKIVSIGGGALRAWCMIIARMTITYPLLRPQAPHPQCQTKPPSPPSCVKPFRPRIKV